MSPARFRCATQLCFDSMKSNTRYSVYVASDNTLLVAMHMVFNVLLLCRGEQYQSRM